MNYQFYLQFINIKTPFKNFNQINRNIHNFKECKKNIYDSKEIFLKLS